MTSIAPPPGSRELDARMRAERKIASQCIKDLHNAGFAITVNDGEEDVVRFSLDHNECLNAMFSTDEDILFAHHPGDTKVVGWVRFIYGNDGFDVINDYTMKLEPVLMKTTALADRLEEELS